MHIGVRKYIINTVFMEVHFVRHLHEYGVYGILSYTYVHLLVSTS